MPTPQFEIQNILKRAQQLDISTQFQPYSGVEIITGTQDANGDDIVYTAGDASGRVLTIYNEWGTQTQANNILASIRGFAYQPYVASGALLDPSAELGDGVSVNDVYSGIYKLSRTYSSLMSANIEAPQSEEIDHEYPYESSQNRQTTRKFSAMESELRMASDEISAKVSATGGLASNVSWSLTAYDWSVYANGSRVFRVTPTGAEVNGKITATSGKIGGFDIGASAISYNGLTWNGTKTGIYLGTQGIQLGSASGSFFQASSSGVVRAHNMTLTGTLTIGGQTITAAALRSGAQSAYSNSGTWTGTTNAWNNATRNGTSSFPTYFTVKSLSATSVSASDYVSGNTVYAKNRFQFGNYYASWKTVTISGVTINYIGR